MFFCGVVLTSKNAAVVKCVQIKPSGGPGFIPKTNHLQPEL